MVHNQEVIWLPLQNLLVEACRIVQPPLPVQRETLPQPGFQLRHPGPLAYRPPHTPHEIVATGEDETPAYWLFAVCCFIALIKASTSLLFRVR